MVTTVRKSSKRDTTVMFVTHCARLFIICVYSISESEQDNEVKHFPKQTRKIQLHTQIYSFNCEHVQQNKNHENSAFHFHNVQHRKEALYCPVP